MEHSLSKKKCVLDRVERGKTLNLKIDWGLSYKKKKIIFMCDNCTFRIILGILLKFYLLGPSQKFVYCRSDVGLCFCVFSEYSRSLSCVQSIDHAFKNTEVGIGKPFFGV
jgi:hypothetical protein